MLILENLSRSWETFSLKNISFQIKKGEYFVLLGPCGAGKTLLLNTIVGIYRPDAGKVFIDRKDMTYLNPEKKRVGYLFQKNMLFPHLSVSANIYYGLRYQRSEEDYIKYIFRLLDISDLFLKKDTLNLSGGEAQKILLARSLVIRPRLLLLDEPLSFLDPASRERALVILKSLNKNLGLTLLHVTHDLKEAEALADHAVVLIDGEIMQNAKLQEIVSQPANSQVRQYLGTNYEH